MADGNVSRDEGERERATGYRHKGDSLTAVRLIGVTGWKINGLDRVVAQKVQEGAVEGWCRDSRRILIPKLSSSFLRSLFLFPCPFVCRHL